MSEGVPARSPVDRLFVLSFVALLTGILSPGTEPAIAASPINISNTSGQSIDPTIAASGPNVYVAWVENVEADNDIIFVASDDGGETFGNQTTFDDGGGISTAPRVAASGPNVYVVWTVTNEIFFSASTDNGSTFSEPENLSSNPTTSANPRVAASGSNVYVAWVDGSSSNADIKLVVSNSTGETFSDQVTLADGGASSDPRIVASDSNAYITWRANVGNNEIFFSASTNNGSSFSEPENLSSNTGSSISPAIAASGSSVHVAWADSTPATPGILVASSADAGGTFGTNPANLNVDGLFAQLPSVAASTAGDVFVAWQVLVDIDNGVIDVFFSNTNNGSSFSEPENLSSNTGSSIEPIVMSSSSGVYVAWRDDFISSANNEILATFSADGENFVSPINLSNSPADTFRLGLALANDDPVVVMYEVPDESTPAEIFLQRDIDFSATVVSIDSVSNSVPRWDIDVVSVSGTVSNSAAGDTVTVDWGDGHLSTEIPLLGTTWGPVDHQFSSGSIPENPVEITAHLMDSSNATKASSSAEEINVQPHSSLPELDPIAAVQPGSNVTISGTLVDIDTSLPVLGELVTLSGTGVDSLGLSGGITTGPDGIFSITGPSPNSTADDWTVQAHFAGNQQHSASDSDLETYATIGSDAVQYNVTSGQNVIVDLTNLSFNASITFENVLEDGSIFVSECATPPSERYEALGFCVDASPAVVLEEDSDITVSVSLGGFGFGGTVMSIDMFHDSAGGIVDITKSRDLGTLTVTGVSTSLSKFIVATAVHEPEPEGALRQQMFVSSEPDNIVTFRNITSTANSTAQISPDKQSYKVGETAVLTVIDPEGNVDPSEIDIVSAGIKSQTSGPDGITIVLHETPASPEVFRGTFTLISGPSSGSSLQAQSGDLLTVAYNIPARAQVVIDGISESGHLQITDYLVPQTAAFTPFGGAIKVELVDAQLSEGSRVRVTLSYANANIGGNNPEDLRLLQEVEDGVWIDITERDFQGNVTGVDTEAKTITGETGTVGSFSIGGDVGTIGGAGGGVSRPGTGLVLDFVASIAASSRGGGGGGGGGSTATIGGPSSSTAQSEEGTNVTSEFETGGDSKVEITFEQVSSSGDIYLKEVDETALPPGAFSSASPTGNTMAVDGSEAETVGKIYDISLSSGFTYEGSLYVTLPYDMDESRNSSSEMNVRLMHFDDGAWEDATVSVNATADTVTGKLNSLSPVVAAVVEDGSYGEAYHESNPHSKVRTAELSLVDQSGNVIDGITPSIGIDRIVVTLANTQRVDQPVTVVAQILDEDNVVVSISWTSVMLERTGSATLTIKPLVDNLAGDHTVRVFVFDSIEVMDVEMLAPALSKVLHVS